jgi:hypothetical protein
MAMAACYFLHPLVVPLHVFTIVLPYFNLDYVQSPFRFVLFSLICRWTLFDISVCHMCYGYTMHAQIGTLVEA